MDFIKLRRKLKRKKPKFLRCNSKNLKRVGEKWRAPKGKQNKLRRHKNNRGFLPSPGYGSPKAVRGFHPSGLKEVMINNMKDLEKINSEKECGRVSSRVGKKKKLEMMKKADEMKVRILNPIKVNK